MFKDIDGLLRATHIAAFGDILDAGFDERFRLSTGDFILSSAWEGNVQMVEVLPGSFAWEIAVMRIQISRGMKVKKSLPLQLQFRDLSDQLGSESLAVVPGKESTLGIGKRDNDTTQFDNFESGVLRNVPAATDSNFLPLE